VKQIGLLSETSAAPALAVPHLFCRADVTDAILASLAGADARPQAYAGVVFAWPRDERESAAAESALASAGAVIHRVQEVLHWDELGEEITGAVVLTYLVKRRPDLSFDAFMTHYREKHAPLARVHHPGIARYVQNFIAPDPAQPAAVDAISELWFRSERDARERFYRDDESRAVIGEDVRRFIDLRSGAAFAARPAR
jgi:uncharacterized protein (TIGR02118 family)